MMNERMLGLVEQAGFEIDEVGDFYLDILMGPLNIEVKALAELIIQECIKIADDSQYSCRTFPVSTSIKQHFGLD